MKTRKLTSVVLVLCLVMSLVSMCFVGTVSATTVNANVAGNQYETVLNLTFEGENAGGIAVRNASDVRVEDGALIVGNPRSNVGGGIWFAKDGSVNSGVAIPNTMNYTTENSPAEDTLFELKSNTTYKLTFKYAFRKDMPSETPLSLHLAIDPYLSGDAADRGGSFSGNCAAVTDRVNAKSGTQEEGNTDYNEWAVETVIFTTKADLTNKYLGMRVNKDGDYKYFKIDDVKLEEYVGETYVFDYKEGETPIDLADYVLAGSNAHYGIANYNKGNSPSKEAPNVDADGLHFRPYKNEKFAYDKDAWKHNCFVADADVNYNGQNGIKFVANMLYIVTVKYKIADLGGNTNVGLGIAVSDRDNIKYTQATREVAYKTFTATTSESQYLTGVVDPGAFPGFAEKTLFLTGYTSNSKQAEILIESVTVTVMEKGADKVAIVKTTETPFVYDVEFVGKGTEVGEGAFVKNPVNNTTEDAYNISYVDPEFHFTKVFTDGSTYAYTPNGVNGKTASVATAQDPERGTVLQISSSKDDTTASVCFNGFKPEVGKKYYISVDFKLVENNTDTSLAFNNIFVSAEAGIMMVGNKQDVGEVKLNTKALSEEWTTNEFIYEHSDASYEYLILTCYHHASIDETKPAFIVLADNFVVEEVTEQVDKQMKREGSTRQASGTGADYVSAGIRFKGSVSESFRESATEIGFYAAPTKALKDKGMNMAEYIKTENNTAVSAKVKAYGMEEILYEITTDKYGRTCYDYQLIITGLTREGVERNLLDTDITCVMYAVVGGETVYTEAFNYCYNYVIYN